MPLRNANLHSLTNLGLLPAGGREKNATFSYGNAGLQSYCCLCVARKRSRFARSRFQGRIGSFATKGSKEELFEDGDKLRGEAVDNEEAVVKWLSRGGLGAVDADDQLNAPDRLQVTSLRLFNS